MYHNIDPVGLIYDGLRIKRSKPKIKEKLLELHLAEDAKQLRKKRKKKSEGRFKATPNMLLKKLLTLKVYNVIRIINN